MGQCTSTNGEDMVGPAGVGMGMAMARAKAADLGQRKSGSNNSSRGRAAATGVEHHPASRNAPAPLAPANGGDKRSGSGNGGAVRAGSSLSSDANSKHVQRLLQSLSLLQALPSLYPWYIAQPALQPALLSICQARWQAIRLGAHELYATVRSADPASSPTLVFFQLFSADLLARCPELHIHLFGSAPLTPRTKPSLSAKLCSLVQTTIASFAFTTSSRRKHAHTSKNRVSSQFDSVSECSELEPSTSGNVNAYAADREAQAQAQPQAASAAERKQRMASLWRQFNNAGINCEALGPFFTSLQNALAQCFGVNEWRGNTQLAWNTLCSTVIEQLIGVESTGAGAPTLISAPSNGAGSGNGNGNGHGDGSGANHLSVDKMDKSEGPLSLMSSPRSHTGSQTMGDTTDTVSRTGHHSHKPSHGGSANAMALKPAAYKQRLDLQSTASRVSRSGYTQSSDVYSPRRSERSPTAHNKTLQLNGLSLPSTQLQLQLQLNSSSQLQPNALSLSVASPFSSSGQPSQSASATPVRRMPSALAQAVGPANTSANPHAGGHGSVQSMSLGLSPLIQLPGQTPSPTTPAQAAAPAPGTAGGSRQGSRHGSRQVTRDDYDDEPCECGAPDCKRCEAQADADADGDDAFDAPPQPPLDAETLRALRETAALDPAQELARFAFHPKPPAKPKVVYMSGLELPPALLAADPATAALVAAADRRAAVYGRSLLGLSRVQPSVQAITAAYEMTALALLSAPPQHLQLQHQHAFATQMQTQMPSSSSSSRVIGASAAHSHNHALSRNHSQARGHANTRSHAPAPAPAPAPAAAASNVSSDPSLTPATSSTASASVSSSNLSLVSRTTTGAGAVAGASAAAVTGVTALSNAPASAHVAPSVGAASAGGVGARPTVSSSTSSNANANASASLLMPLPPVVSVSA